MALTQMMSWSKTFEIEMDESTLARGERESADKETVLAREADQVDRAIPILQSRLDRLRTRAQALSPSGETTGLLRDLAAVNLPPPGRPLAWGKALEMRQEALRARHSAQDAVEQDTALRSRALARVSSAANRFEKMLAEIESRPAKVEPKRTDSVATVPVDEMTRALERKREITKADAATLARPGELERALGRVGPSRPQPIAPTRPIALTQPVAPAPARAERRAFPRVRLETEVTLQSDSNFYSGFAEDVSSGGLFVATHKYQPVGSTVDVSFQLGNRVVEATGMVRWIREIDDKNPDVLPGMGIQFTSVPVDAQRDILQFVKAREPLFYAD